LQTYEADREVFGLEDGSCSALRSARARCASLEGAYVLVRGLITYFPGTRWSLDDVMQSSFFEPLRNCTVPAGASVQCFGGDDTT
jgi:hypothetical protein